MIEKKLNNDLIKAHEYCINNREELEKDTLAYTYIEKGKFGLIEKDKPMLQDSRDAIVTVVALYDEVQTLPLPDRYGKNLIFKTGGVDGCTAARSSTSSPRERSTPLR